MYVACVYVFVFFGTWRSLQNSDVTGKDLIRASSVPRKTTFERITTRFQFSLPILYNILHPI